MSDSEQYIRDRSNGQLAQQVLENPEYVKVFIVLKAKILAEMENTTFKQHDERDELWRQMQTLRNMEKHFSSVISNGRIADQKITLLQRAKNGYKTVMG